jgi:hypothetical protein
MIDNVLELRAWANDDMDPERAQMMRMAADEIHGLRSAMADVRRLTRELDVALNGERGAAKQASLCDIVSQMKSMRREALSQLST